MGKRLITQRRGSGTSLYRSPSHRHVDDVRLPAMSEGTAVIKDLIQAPGRTCPLAVLDLNGRTDYQLAVEGTKVGQTIVIGGTDVVAGNITKLSNIPEGTLVHNVEARPGDGIHSGIQDQGSRDEPGRPPPRWWKPRPRWRTELSEEDRIARSEGGFPAS